MKTISVEQLNNRFAFQQRGHSLGFKIGKGDIPVVEICNRLASASISLQGAHVLSWAPVGEAEVLWVSQEARFAPSKSVRGGIPVCWPWFGAHGDDPSYPAHGFARTVMWQVEAARILPAGSTQITFKLDTTELDENVQNMWPAATIAEYRVTIADTLTIENGVSLLGRRCIPILVLGKLATLKCMA